MTRSKMLLGKTKIFLSLVGIITLFFALQPNYVLAVDCPPPPPGGNYTLSTSCTFVGGVNGLDNGNLTINSGATLTVNSGQKIVFNNGKSITVNGSILPNGEIKKTNLWMQDYRNAGYPNNWVQKASDNNPGYGYVRRSSLVDIPTSANPSLRTVIDCNFTIITEGAVDTSRCPDGGTAHYNQTSGLNVQLKGWYGSNGQGNVEYWFGYGTTPFQEVSGTKTCTDRSDNPSGWKRTAHNTANTGSAILDAYFTIPVSDLAYGTKYYYCFITRNNYGINFGQLESFITPPNVGGGFSSALSRGRIVTTVFGDASLGQSMILEAWFAYGTSGSSCSALTSTVPGYSGGPTNDVDFIGDINVSPGTTYKYCPVVDNGALQSQTGPDLYGYGPFRTFTPYTLQVAVSGSGYGSVSIPTQYDPNPNQTCNAPGPGSTHTCSYTYTYDTSTSIPSPTLSASENSGSRFGGWSGDCNSSGQVTMSSDKICYANFIKTYVLTTSSSSGGSVSPSGSNTYDTGTNVNVSANASYGWHFDNWSGLNCSGGSSSKTVVMDRDRNCDADFDRNQYTLTMSAGTGGSVSPGSGTYYYEDTVNVSANPNSSHYSFGSWSGTNCSGGSQSKTITITGNTTCSASFNIDSHTLSTSTGGTGSGSVSGAGTYTHGTNKTVTATDGFNSVFSRWEGHCSGTSRTTSVLMDNDKSCRAIFTRITGL